MSKSFGLFTRDFQGWPPVAFLTVLLVSMVVLLPGSRLHAQVENGINGTVMDSSGAVIVGAHITVTNVASGAVSGPQPPPRAPLRWLDCNRGTIP